MSGPLGRGSSLDDVMAAGETDRNFFAVQLAYRLCLDREPEPDMLADRVRLLEDGDAFRDMLIEIATGPEARALAARSGIALTGRGRGAAAAPGEADRNAFVVELAYRTCLGRDPEPGMLEARVRDLDAGAPFRDMLFEIATGPEARARAGRKLGRLGASCSDGQFLSIVGGLLNGRGLLPAEVEAGRRHLAEDPAARTRYVMNAVDHLVSRRMAAGAAEDAPHDADRVHVMGTDRVLTRAMWDERARELGPGAPASPGRRPGAVPPARPHTGRYAVSMIASLYRGGRFIEKFLSNVTAQSLFPESELIIVDADSPEGEGEVVAAFMEHHPNIVYERVNFRIGIYEAWNRGVELARGRYLTNTNLDDLRHPDSIALQAAMLDREPGVDVVYQDFFYSFDPDLDFDEVARFGFRSQLPIVCPHNILAFNSPHNAPMWRRSLHDELGPFDTSYRSAGDYEFWARCVSRGKTFRKANAPHVVYYQNAEGISTRPDTRGVEEAHRILARYAPLLTSPTLLQSRADLEASLGLRPGAGEADRRYYDLIGDELLRVGAAGARAGTRRAATVERPLRLVVDGVAFQRAGTDAARVWASLLPRLAADGGVDVVLLDRGGAPSVPGVTSRPFPSYTATYTAADSVLLQEFCGGIGADVFASTGFTSALTTPQVQLVHDLAGTDPGSRAAKEQRLALSYAAHLACTSAATRDDLLRLCPGIAPDRAVVARCGVDAAVFDPSASARVEAWRERDGVGRDYVVVAGAPEGHGGSDAAELVLDAARLDPLARFDVVRLGGGRGVGARPPGGVRVLDLDLSDRDRAAAYAGAIALVHTRPRDGAGLAIVEAMASGCPVIAAPHGAPAEVAGDAALLVSGRDPRELLRGLYRVQVSGRRRGMRAAGLARARLFDRDAMAGRFRALLRAAVAERGEASVVDFHRRWRQLRAAQADVDVGVD